MRSRARAKLRLRRRAARFRWCCIRPPRRGARCYASAARWADSTVPRCSIRAWAGNAEARTHDCATGLSRAQRVRRMPGGRDGGADVSRRNRESTCRADWAFVRRRGRDQRGNVSPIVTTVIALSSQLAGAHVAGELAPKPLLLIHGGRTRFFRTKVRRRFTIARASRRRSGFCRASDTDWRRHPRKCSRW